MVIVFQKRRLLGAVIAVLTVLAVVSVQYRVQMFLLQQAKWQSVLANKFLFILLLRQQNLELLILFCLYLIGDFLYSLFEPRGDGSASPSMSPRCRSRPGDARLGERWQRRKG